VGPRTDLDDVERRNFLPLPGLELRPLGRHTRSQSLYRLRYPARNIEHYARKTSKYPTLLKDTTYMLIIHEGNFLL
jgi:hypothetical protein